MRRTKMLGKVPAFDFLKYKAARVFSSNVKGKPKTSEDL
jgi:hypothetical protein